MPAHGHERMNLTTRHRKQQSVEFLSNCLENPYPPDQYGTTKPVGWGQIYPFFPPLSTLFQMEIGLFGVIYKNC